MINTWEVTALVNCYEGKATRTLFIVIILLYHVGFDIQSIKGFQDCALIFARVKIDCLTFMFIKRLTFSNLLKVVSINAKIIDLSLILKMPVLRYAAQN